MGAENPSLSVRLLRRLAALVMTRPAWVVGPQVLLFAVSLWFTWTHLEFDMDRNSLVDANLEYHRNFLALKKQFPGEDDLVAVVESEDLEKNRQFVERLAARLEANSTDRNATNVFTDVFYKGDLKLMGPKALLFLSETNLHDLHQALIDYRPFLNQFSSASNLVTLFQRVNTAIRTSGRQESAQTESLLKALPALERIVRRAEQSLERSGTPPSPGVDALFGAGAEAERAKYVTFAEGRIYLVTARPRLVLPEELPPELRTSKPARDALQARLNSESVRRFRELVQATRAEVGGVNLGVTGGTVLEYDEMQQSQRDTTKATVLSLVLCALIFIFGYRATGRPLKATLCLIVGLGYTMAYTTLVIGHLNILTITFVPMLIGLAIDFGVHLITRYEEEIRHGRSEAAAMDRAMVNTGQGIFTGCFTTAGAFLAMSLTSFRGIVEMGLIAGGGLIICLVPMMTLLPVLLLRGRRQNLIDEALGAQTLREEALESFETGGEALAVRARLERFWLDRPWTVIGLASVLTLLCVPGVLRMRFDYNLLNLQSASLPAVVFEKKLLATSDKSALYGAVLATNAQEAMALAVRLRELPSVGSTETMARFVVEDSGAKLGLIRQITNAVAPIRFPEPDRRPVDLTDLSQTLFGLQGYLGLAADEVAKIEREELFNQLNSLRDSLARLRQAMFRGDAAAKARAAQKLGAYQQALFDDIRETFAALANQDAAAGLLVPDLPAALRHRFIGLDGSFLIQVYPRTNVWDRAPQEAFVKELQAAVPKATGEPVQLYYYTELLRSSYVESAGWALGAIVLLVFIHFRRVSAVFLSLLPVFLGAVWVVGLMGWLDRPFNPANIMMLPLVIGIGVTNGIHILNRFAEEKNPGILAKSTGKAVLVSGLTTIAGFGSLVIADHEGISSLGWVLGAGTSACLVAGLTVLPAILTLLGRGRSVAAAAEVL
jgi:hopanoid biosynthesis associated RND transporter like protein HpnN